MLGDPLSSPVSSVITALCRACCTRSANTSLAIRKRREGQPAWAIDLAEKAQRRLYRRYRRLTEAGKHKNVAVIAVAREFVGFIWAMLTHHRLLSEGSHAVA